MNSPITVLIVDDEAPARHKLIGYLEKDKRFSLVAEAKNGQQAILEINNRKPQLILLDIQMPGLSGFDVLRLMDSQNISVIFTTAYDEYAVEAFDVSAIDYLLKPINEDRFRKALDKVSTTLSQDWQLKISTVLQSLKSSSFINRLSVRHGQLTKIMQVNDIKVILSENRLVTVHDKFGARFWTNEKLSDLERRLNPKKFMRVHRSSIINLAADFEVSPHSSGRVKIVYIEGLEVVVSREYTRKFKKWLSEPNHDQLSLP